MKQFFKNILYLFSSILPIYAPPIQILSFPDLNFCNQLAKVETVAQLFLIDKSVA